MAGRKVPRERELPSGAGAAGTRAGGLPMKAEDVRLEQTIKYIGKTPLFPAAYRADVKAFAEAYAGRARWPGNFVLPIAGKYGDYQRFSAEMTMTDVHSPGNKDERAMRRAIFLLYSAIGDSQAAATAKSMLVGRVQDFGGPLVGAHIKPGGAVDGTTLARQLDGLEANVAGGYDPRLTGDGKYATIIGINRHGTWRVYCQEQHERDIIKAREIH